MLGIANRFARKPVAEVREAFVAPLQPDKPFWVIGDVHGRADLLERLGEDIEAAHPDIPVVLVGDYIDRGEHSADVLRILHHVTQQSPGQVICLKGNHEAMCLDFLDSPENHGARWLRHGGLQTMASFGVGGLANTRDDAALRKLRDALALALGDTLIEWMRGLPLHWNSGNIHVVHAAADPDRPLSEQKEKTLLWGHRDFLTRSRTDAQWVVHGHTIFDSPQVEGGRVAVDTGAYATGHLTAALFREDRVEFLST